MLMKTSTLNSRRAAFTLLELLVVITIIGVLAGLCLGAYSHVMDIGRNTQAKNSIKGIQIAIANYRTETGRMPVWGHDGSDVRVETTADNPLLQVLLGENVNGLNARGINYLGDLPLAKNGMNGLSGSDDHFSFVDPWGQPFRVTMDTNFDGKVANPDAQNQDSEFSRNAPKSMPSSATVESAGKDKRFGTRDDVVSWR